MDILSSPLLAGSLIRRRALAVLALAPLLAAAAAGPSPAAITRADAEAIHDALEAYLRQHRGEALPGWPASLWPLIAEHAKKPFANAQGALSLAPWALVPSAEERAAKLAVMVANNAGRRFRVIARLERRESGWTVCGLSLEEAWRAK